MHSEADFRNPFRSDEKRGPAGAGEDAEGGRDSPPLVFAARDWHYDMAGDKILHVFSHYNYQKSRYFRSPPAARTGAARDAASLARVFAARGFRVTTHWDLTHEQILDVVAQLSAAPHSGTACVALAVLTHGGGGGELMAADRPYELRDLLTPLQYGSAGLVGKPKILIVQACRGDLLDGGREVELDGEAAGALPTHADCLVLSSSVDEHVSWRDARGSWLVRALRRVLDGAAELDALRMATLVAGLVAERSSNTPRSPRTHGMKQAVEARSTLTKLLVLPPPRGPGDGDGDQRKQLIP